MADGPSTHDELWNAVHPIGTRVRYWRGLRSGEGQVSTTRSEAWRLGSGEPVVMVEGCAGGIALTHVVALGGEDA